MIELRIGYSAHTILYTTANTTRWESEDIVCAGYWSEITMQVGAAMCKASIPAQYSLCCR